MLVRVVHLQMLVADIYSQCVGLRKGYKLRENDLNVPAALLAFGQGYDVVLTSAVG